MKHPRLRSRIVIAAVALLGLWVLLYVCLKPDLKSNSCWLRRVVGETHAMSDGPARETLLGRVAEAYAQSGEFAQALEAVEAISKPKLSLFTRILREAKGLLARIGISSAPQALPVFKAGFIFSTSRHIEEQAYATIAAAQAKAGDTAGAHGTAERIATPGASLAKALLSIALAQAEGADLAGAEAEAGVMDKKNPTNTHLAAAKVQAYKAIALAHARAGDAARALETANAIPRLAPTYGYMVSGSLDARIAQALARAGHADAALEVANKITDPRKKADAYHAVAVAAADLRDLARAKDIARSIAVDHTRWQAEAHIAGTLAAAGKTAQAKTVAQAIDDPCLRSYAYRKVSEAQARKGEISAARATASRIHDPAFESDAYYAIARAQLEAGLPREALAAAVLITGEKKLKIYLLLADAYARSGNTRSYAKCVGLAKEAMPSLCAEDRPAGWRAIAETQARAGHLSGAAATMNAHTKACRFRAPALPRPDRGIVATGDDLKSAMPSDLRIKVLRAIGKGYVAGPGSLGRLYKWIRTLKTPIERGYTCLGAAEGLIEKRAESKAKRGSD